MRTDVLSVSPMEMVVADMRPDSPGTWLFHCHISFHNAAGMAAIRGYGVRVSFVTIQSGGTGLPQSALPADSAAAPLTRCDFQPGTETQTTGHCRVPDRARISHT
jgi:Multicopper oxidase